MLEPKPANTQLACLAPTSLSDKSEILTQHTLPSRDVAIAEPYPNGKESRAPTEREVKQIPELMEFRPLKGRLFDGYFRPKEFEARGTIYRALGVKYFKTALMSTIGLVHAYIKERTNGGNNYCLGGHSVFDLKKMESKTRVNEGIHICTVLAFAPLILADTFYMQNLLVNSAILALNFYCIALQRYNRERLYKTIAVAESRASNRIPHFKSSGRKFSGGALPTHH